MSANADDMLDITAPNFLEVEISEDGKRLWINVDGVCRLRACQIEQLTVASWPPSVRITVKVNEALI